MSKIICDICGTAYPETADQCPICGCAKGEDPQIVAEDTPQENPGEVVRTPVKGGRFSKKNVRKRNKAVIAEAKAAGTPVSQEAPEKNQSNKGLVIAAVLLLLAVIAMMGFIYIRYFMPRGNGPDSTNDGTAQTTLSADTTAAPDTTASQENNSQGNNSQGNNSQDIPCQELALKSAIVELGAKNEAWLLEVNVTPKNTTDTLTFATSDPTVVSVTNKGRLTAVGPGQAVITITCGDQETKCRVVCNFQEEIPDDPTVPASSDPAVVDGQISLNREDITMSKEGETWQLYNGTVGKNLVTWTSSDENVATVDGGLVTAVGGGTATITAEYGDQKVSCIVRCSLPVVGGDTGSGSDNGTGGGITEDPVCTISHTDVTLSIGESFKLTLKDGGNVVSVNWTVKDSTVCSVDGNTVTAKASGTTTISVSYGGNTYTCTVRVK